MSIVLKENEWAHDMIRSSSLGKKPTETLRRVARYYIDQGCSVSDTRKRLDSFLIRCEPTSSLPQWSDSLDRAVNAARKYNAVEIDCITITDTEMNKIDSLDGKQIKRLAFTLLCLAKYWKILIPDGDYWVKSKDNEIMSMANINTSIKRQSLMYWTLRESGMLQFSKRVDNTSVRVCFVENGEPVLHVTDFRNLGYQYLMYHGEPYFECVSCGITTKIKNPNNGRKPKYCPDCAAKISMKQNIDSAMRRRYIDIEGCDTSADIYTVYMHRCPNDKRYVGMTSTTLHKRWKNGLGYANNKPFYSDIKKYGWDNIKHYKIAVTQDESLAKDIELYYIQKYKTAESKSGYNRTLGEIIHIYDNDVINTYLPIEVNSMGHTMR